MPWTKKNPSLVNQYPQTELFAAFDDGIDEAYAKPSEWPFSEPGFLAVSPADPEKIGWMAWGARTIVAVRMRVGTLPIGASVIIDLNKDGTTIYTTQANRPTIAPGGPNIITATLPDIVNFADGNVLTMDIDQVGSVGTEGANLSVQVRYI